MNKLIRKYPVGMISGMFLGVFVIHPFSMVFQKLVHPGLGLDVAGFGDAFNYHHLPMAVFFGILGTLVGAVNVFYTSRIMKGRERIRELEGLLPICAYCKKIRDDEGRGKGEGAWHELEHYIRKKADVDFTHGICPECYGKVMAELDAEDETAASHA